MENRYKCPCCGVLSLDEERCWDICELCWWENDYYQADNPDTHGGPNNSSLNKWKNKFNDSINELIKGEFYCSLLEKKIRLDTCAEMPDVIDDGRQKVSVHILDRYNEEYCKVICNSCPIYKVM